jgi:general secretion pathway protein M
MMKLDREQVISVGVLALILLACAAAVELTFHARYGAAQELAERGDRLTRLQARAKADADRRAAAVAPADAFVSAPTQGVAGAQLQAHLMKLAGEQRANVISSGIEPGKREDQPDSIRLQATLELNAAALQALLYQLESGTPYVFVDALAVQRPAGVSQRAAEDPLLRVTLGLRAVWRRGAA